MLKAIGQVFGKILGTDKALESGINSIANGFDKLHYGDQEKAEHQMQNNQAIRDFITTYMAATNGQNVARRLIALPVVYTWLCMFVFMAFCSILSVWVNNPVDVLNTAGEVVKVNGLLEAASRMKPYAMEMKEIVMVVAVFYFGPHMLAKAQSMFAKKPQQD